jgi:hypothetical protein
MNDRSPWLPLTNKYLRVRGLLQNRWLISLRVALDGFIPGPGRRIFRPTVPEFDARLIDRELANFDH